MPAQAMGAAVDAYVATTGKSLLADESLLQGRVSSPVYGSLSAGEALRILLAGSGLAVSFESARSFSVRVANVQEAPQPAEDGPPAHDGHARFYLDLQHALRLAFCRGATTKPLNYDGVLQLWFRQDGVIRAAHLAAGTGDAARDAEIVTAVSGLYVQALPRGLAQPLTIAIKQTRSRLDDCEKPAQAYP